MKIRHMKNKHGVVIEPLFSCNKCEKTFGDVKKLNKQLEELSVVFWKYIQQFGFTDDNTIWNHIFIDIMFILTSIADFDFLCIEFIVTLGSSWHLLHNLTLYSSWHPLHILSLYVFIHIDIMSILIFIAYSEFPCVNLSWH